MTSTPPAATPLHRPHRRVVARHRWLVAAGWFLATIGVSVAGNAPAGPRRAARPSARTGQFEAREAYDVFGASGPTDARPRPSTSSCPRPAASRTPAFQAAIADAVDRLRALQVTLDGQAQPVFEEVIDPLTAPPQAGLVSPDGTTVRSSPAHPRERRTPRRARAGRPGDPEEIQAAHPEFAIHGLSRHARQRADQRDRQRRPRRLAADHDPAHVRDPARRVRRPGRGDRPAGPRRDRAARRVRRPRPVQPVRLPDQPVRRPARRPDRPRRRGRLLAVHDQPLPHRARRRREKDAAIRVASATAGRAVFFSGLAVMISIARPVPARRPAVPLDGGRDDRGRGHLGRRLAHVPPGASWRSSADASTGAGSRTSAAQRDRGQRLLEPDRPRRPCATRSSSAASAGVPAPARVAGHAAAHRPERPLVVPGLGRLRPGDPAHEREMAAGHHARSSTSSSPAASRRETQATIERFNELVAPDPGSERAGATRHVRRRHGRPDVRYTMAGSQNDLANRAIVREVRAETVPSGLRSMPGVRALVSGDAAWTADIVGFYENGMLQVFAFVLGSRSCCCSSRSARSSSRSRRSCSTCSRPARPTA